jgi:hypothetical protein
MNARCVVHPISSEIEGVAAGCKAMGWRRKGRDAEIRQYIHRIKCVV